jgi:hypothetical protein
MKKLALILCFVCFACTTPEGREQQPKEWGEIVYRTHPFTTDICSEVFIIKREGRLYLMESNKNPVLLPKFCDKEKEE